jgi:hypothetical protein
MRFFAMESQKTRSADLAAADSIGQEYLPKLVPTPQRGR